MGKKNRLISIRIYLTENCNANCPHCFNAKIRVPKHMDFYKTLDLFEYLSSNGTKVLKIMGGEPTIHPHFKEIYKAAQNNFLIVNLFTNSLNSSILNIVPRSPDSIIYNFFFVNDKFNFKKLLPEIQEFIRSFEIVIDPSTDIDSLISRIEFTYSKCLELGIKSDYLRFQLTLNCVENIFIKRKLLNNSFLKVAQHVYSLSPKMLSFDHTVPHCFWTEESKIKFQDMNSDYFKWTCTGKDTGLIDSDFNLLHCNQHPVKLANMFSNNGGNEKFIRFEYLQNLLLLENYRKKIINLEKDCINCSYFDSACTGSCFYHKEFVHKILPESNLENVMN